MNIRTIMYVLILLSILFVDRLTKLMAIAHWQEPFVINPFLYFHVTYNRGISWGFLNNGTSVAAIIIGVTLLTLSLAGHSLHKRKKGISIFGEIFIIGGAISNTIDRFMYGGVVDYIVFHVGSWSWPAFNIADAYIVIGVAIMFVQILYEHETA